MTLISWALRTAAWHLPEGTCRGEVLFPGEHLQYETPDLHAAGYRYDGYGSRAAPRPHEAAVHPGGAQWERDETYEPRVALGVLHAQVR